MATTLKEYIINFRIKYSRDPSDEEKKAFELARLRARQLQREREEARKEAHALAKEEREQIAQGSKARERAASQQRQREAATRKDNAVADKLEEALRRKREAATRRDNADRDREIDRRVKQNRAIDDIGRLAAKNVRVVEKQEADRRKRDRTAADKAVAALQRQSEAKEEKEAKRLHQEEVRRTRVAGHERDAGVRRSLAGVARIGGALKGFVAGFFTIAAIRQIAEAIEETGKEIEQRRRVSEQINAPPGDVKATESAYERQTGRPGREISEQVIAFQQKTLPGSKGESWAANFGVTEKNNALLRFEQFARGVIKVQKEEGAAAAERVASEGGGATLLQLHDFLDSLSRVPEAKRLAGLHRDPDDVQRAIEKSAKQFADINEQHKAILENITRALAEGTLPALIAYNQLLQNNASTIKVVVGAIGDLASAFGAFFGQVFHGADVLLRLGRESRPTTKQAGVGIASLYGGVDASQTPGSPPTAPPAAASKGWPGFIDALGGAPAAPPVAPPPAVDPDRFKRDPGFDSRRFELFGPAKKFEEHSAVQGTAAAKIEKAAATEERAANTFAEAVDQDVKQREKAQSQSLWQQVMGAVGNAWTGAKNAFSGGGGGPGDTGFIGTPSVTGGGGGGGGTPGAPNLRYGPGGKTPGGAIKLGGPTQAAGLTDAQSGFLRTLSGKGIEGADYNTIVGGGTFSDYSKHPGIVGVHTAAGPSTAAGRYQFTKTTWDRLAAKYGLKDFSPATQDRAALLLAREDYARRAPGRSFDADVEAAAKGDQQAAESLRQGLGGTGANTTWQGLQKIAPQAWADRLAGAAKQPAGGEAPTASSLTAGGARPTGFDVGGGFGASPHQASDQLSSEQIQTNKAILDRYRGVLNADDPNRVGRGGSGYRPGGGSSQHARARGLDLRAGTAAEADQVMAEQRQRLTAKGLVEGRDFSFLDEVRHPSGGATGPHVHLSLSQEGIEKLDERAKPVARDPDRMARDTPAPTPEPILRPGEKGYKGPARVPVSLQDLPGFGRNAAAIRANAGIVSPETAPGGVASAAPLSSGDVANDNSRSVTQHNTFKTTIHTNDAAAAASLYKRANEQHAGTALGNIRPVMR